MKKIITILIFVALLVPGCTFVIPTSSTPIANPPIPSPIPNIQLMIGPKIVSFIASPLEITAGQSVLLTWTIDSAISVVIEPGIGNVSLSGSREMTPGATTKYTITATSENGTASGSQIVTVDTPPNIVQSTPTIPKPEVPPVIVYFTVNPVHAYAGSAITLTWNITGATSITVDNDVDSNKYTSSKGSDDMVARPIIDTVFRIIAKNSAGTSQATVIVTIDLSLSTGIIPDNGPCG